jgi:hypothetical protein
VYERGVAEERRRVESEFPDELDAFDGARGLIEERLEEHEAFMPDHGWVGFATSDGLRHAEGVPVPMPDLVRWERGLRAAPYIRALKQERVVVAVIADSRKCRLFTYQNGQVEEAVDLIADRDFGDLADSVSSKRAARFTGARGETGTDVAQRLNDRAASLMQGEILDVLEEQAGADGLVILGGRAEVVSALGRGADRFGDRWVEVPSMHLTMTLPEVKLVIEDAASELTRRLQNEALVAVLDQARAGGRGSLGIQATKEALREGRVDALLLTPGFREREPDLADRFVGTAFQQSATVDELSGDVAEHLDREGEGVAARLRYTL